MRKSKQPAQRSKSSAKRKKRQPDDIFALKVRKVKITVVVFMGFNEEKEVGLDFEEAPFGRDEARVVVPDSAFAFFFADLVQFHWLGGKNEVMSVLGILGNGGLDGIDYETAGPTFYRPECRFGSAAEFLADFPVDVELAPHVPKGTQFVLISEPLAPKAVRYYRTKEKGDRHMSPRRSSVSDDNRGGHQEPAIEEVPELVAGQGVGGAVN